MRLNGVHQLMPRTRWQAMIKPPTRRSLALQGGLEGADDGKGASVLRCCVESFLVVVTADDSCANLCVQESFVEETTLHRLHSSRITRHKLRQ